MDVRVKDIIKICNGTLICGNEETICENFSKDTRTIQKNDTYVGIKGERFDGNCFYEDALEKGAKVCILQNMEILDEVKKKYEDRCIILVEDTIKAIQQIASYKRDLYNIPVVAVTGSAGKTSTKDMIASVVGTSYNVLKTAGNLNNHIGVPMTILGLKKHNALVVEMGMNNLGEISVLSKIAKPNIAVITNVGTAHIGNLGSRENILKAKLEIVEGLKEDGILIINNDNDLLHEWQKDQKGNLKIETYGIENDSNLTALNIQLEDNSSNFYVHFKQNENNRMDDENILVPVGGLHFIYNALCAIAVGKILGISMEKIKIGIANFELSKNRMEIEKTNGVTIVNDCYNANFDSMKAALESVSKMEGKRRIAILGDMLELGEFSKELHNKVGLEVVKNNIDILVTVGKEAENIANIACEKGMNETYTLKSNEEAINLMRSIVKNGDIILIKASNGMKFIEIVNSLKEMVLKKL
ncbi:MAG: UDP-N-acetylmuramoyl-tripeptide--D-alanyl-D-alanine ligase [Clostridia bacterium]|nr:UDP-N-acetylmuramoyl-tripeptide--D-alanyl-D-alanine ligase [Clostridia bacterium]